MLQFVYGCPGGGKSRFIFETIAQRSREGARVILLVPERFSLTAEQQICALCDKEQMLRIFATSGLYRANKSADYYECTVIKAIRDTTERFQPNQKTSFSPTNIKGNSFDKGGR